MKRSEDGSVAPGPPLSAALPSQSKSNPQGWVLSEDRAQAQVGAAWPAVLSSRPLLTPPCFLHQRLCH